VRRAVDDLAIAARIEQLKLVIRCSIGERSRIKLFDRRLA
jgi:hypothetical protein